MKDETIATEFTSDLRAFLERRGYTHLLSLGIDPKEVNDASEPETDKENYWLRPIKKEEEESNNTTGLNSSPIQSAEVLAMVAGEDNVQYMVKVPLVDYNDYLAKR